MAVAPKLPTGTVGRRDFLLKTSFLAAAPLVGQTREALAVQGSTAGRIPGRFMDLAEPIANV